MSGIAISGIILLVLHLLLSAASALVAKHMGETKWGELIPFLLIPIFGPCIAIFVYVFGKDYNPKKQ